MTDQSPVTDKDTSRIVYRFEGGPMDGRMEEVPWDIRSAGMVSAEHPRMTAGGASYEKDGQRWEGGVMTLRMKHAP